MPRGRILTNWEERGWGLSGWSSAKQREEVGVPVQDFENRFDCSRGFARGLREVVWREWTTPGCAGPWRTASGFEFCAEPWKT